MKSLPAVGGFFSVTICGEEEKRFEEVQSRKSGRRACGVNT